MKDVHSKSLRTIALLLIIFAIQAIVCLYIAYQKQYLFTDEVYSYGLANSETTAFIDPGESPELMIAWQDNSYFRNYIKFDTSRSFSFQAAFANQAKDVHPPLVQLMCTGIAGEYLAKTYLEVKHRPIYIVAETEEDLSKKELTQCS